MKCDRAIERLLEADPAELRGRGESELSRHVTECDRCGRIAAALLAELAVVDEALSAYGASGDADAAAERALAARLEDPGSRVHDGTSTIGDPVPRRSLGGRRVWVPLAAAAALVTLLLTGRDGAPPAPAPGPTPAPETAPRVAVSPPSDRGVAVIETENPEITIVWLYEREES